MLYIPGKISELDFIASMYTGIHITTNVFSITITYPRLRLMEYIIVGRVDYG